jgi:hypothetical protein
MAKVEVSILEELKGRDLSAVTFVRDYLQLHFDGPYFNCFVWPRIITATNAVNIDSLGYRDILCAQIGKVVGGMVEEKDMRFRFFFTDGSMIEVSLQPKDRRGPEALLFQNGKGDFRVW